jgi:Glycosyltransferase family 87
VGRLVRRVDALLTWKRACFWAALLCLLYVVAYVFVLVTGRPPLNASGEPIGGDYIAFHAAGRLLVAGEGAHLYDRDRLAVIQDALLAGRVPGFYDAFRNPPFIALVFAPLSVLELIPGFTVWSLISMGCLVAAVLLVLAETRSRQPGVAGSLLLVCAFGPVFFGLINGQNATVSLLLYALMYRALVRDKPRAAGVWAALGLFKPQLFFVFPLVFLVSRRWRALAAYTVTAAGLAVLSVALVGVDGVQGWLRILVDMETGNATRNLWRMHSLKAFFDALLPGQTGLSLALYVASAVPILVGLAALWVRRATPMPVLWALTVVVAVLVDPHLVDYDMTVLVSAAVAAPVAFLRLRWWIALLYGLLLLRAQLPLGNDAALDLTAVLLGCIAVVIGHACVTDRPGTPASSYALPNSGMLGVRVERGV